MPAKLRPVPDDWHTIAPTITQLEAAKRYRCGKAAISRWIKESGVRCGQYAANCPKDLPDNLATLANGQTITSLAQITGMARTTLATKIKIAMPDVYAMLVRNGRQNIATCTSQRLKGQTFNRRPVPDGFADDCRTMTRKELALKHKADEKTVSRWIKTMPANVIAAYRANARKRQSAAIRGAFALKNVSTAFSVQADPVTLADKAMRWLQTKEPYCYPLRIYGQNLPGYRMRGRVWQADELVAEARKRGWNPDAWREIAQGRAA